MLSKDGRLLGIPLVMAAVNLAATASEVYTEVFIMQGKAENSLCLSSSYQILRPVQYPQARGQMPEGSNSFTIVLPSPLLGWPAARLESANKRRLYMASRYRSIH
jgi:hypothetical protein